METLSKIKDQVERLVLDLPSASRPLAFWDFDGTLLFGDCTEGRLVKGCPYRGLMEEVGDSGLLPHFQGRNRVENLLSAYMTRHSENQNTFLADEIESIPKARRKDLKNLIHRVYSDTLSLYFFPEMKNLMMRFAEMGVENHLISASIQVFVEEACDHLPVLRPHVHAVKPTSYFDPVIYHGEGKKRKMLEILKDRSHLSPVSVVFAAGNSRSADGDMVLQSYERGGVGFFINPFDGPKESWPKYGQVPEILYPFWG